MRAKAPEALAGLFALIETQLSDGRPFVHGDRYTVSDPYLFVMTGWVYGRELLDPAATPFLRRHRERVAARPAVVRALEREARTE